MGEITGIAWCDHTFNPWWGCVERSEGCDNCYAREMANRFAPGLWGKDAGRRFFGDKHWNEPLRWDRKATLAGVRRRVFSGSMCDIMEDRRDLDAARARLFLTVESTPNLDWLFCTKLPQNYRRLLPAEWLRNPRRNVWGLTTVENQQNVWRAHELLLTPLVIRGISYEPALGPLDWSGLHLKPATLGDAAGFPDHNGTDGHAGIHWPIIGGESGAGARRFELAWARAAIARCQEAGVPVFMKQLGSNCEIPTRHAAGADPNEWPEDLRVREFPVLGG